MIEKKVIPFFPQRWHTDGVFYMYTELLFWPNLDILRFWDCNQLFPTSLWLVALGKITQAIDKKVIPFFPLRWHTDRVFYVYTELLFWPNLDILRCWDCNPLFPTSLWQVALCMTTQAIEKNWFQFFPQRWHTDRVFYLYTELYFWPDLDILRFWDCNKLFPKSLWHVTLGKIRQAIEKKVITFFTLKWHIDSILRVYWTTFLALLGHFKVLGLLSTVSNITLTCRTM